MTGPFNNPDSTDDHPNHGSTRTFAPSNPAANAVSNRTNQIHQVKDDDKLKQPYRSTSSHHRDSSSEEKDEEGTVDVENALKEKEHHHHHQLPSTQYRIPQRDDDDLEKWSSDPANHVQEKSKAPHQSNSHRRQAENDDGKLKHAMQDVEATGKWGTLTQAEVYSVGSLVFVVVVAVIVMLVYFIDGSTGHDSHDSGTGSATNRNSSITNNGNFGYDNGGGTSNGSNTSTTSVIDAPVEQYRIVLNAVADDPVTTELFLSARNGGTQPPLLPGTLDEVRALIAELDDDLNGTTVQYDPVHAALRAASWLVDTDPVNGADVLVTRFALATIYYSLGGEAWWSQQSVSEGQDHQPWLSPVSHCDWRGIDCGIIHDATTTTIAEVDLSDSNLSGSLMFATWPMLRDVRALWLNGNVIRGAIPGLLLGAMPNLRYLYLQSNELTGSIPASLMDNGLLQTLYVQDNSLNGTWPMEFCPSCADCNDGPFNNYGVDCMEIPCACCIPMENCF